MNIIPLCNCNDYLNVLLHGLVNENVLCSNVIVVSFVVFFTTLVIVIGFCYCAKLLLNFILSYVEISVWKKKRDSKK